MPGPTLLQTLVSHRRLHDSFVLIVLDPSVSAKVPHTADSEIRNNQQTQVAQESAGELEKHFDDLLARKPSTNVQIKPRFPGPRTPKPNEHGPTNAPGQNSVLFGDKSIYTSIGGPAYPRQDQSKNNGITSAGKADTTAMFGGTGTSQLPNQPLDRGTDNTSSGEVQQAQAAESSEADTLKSAMATTQEPREPGTRYQYEFC